jgi:hypothetical protein
MTLFVCSIARTTQGQYGTALADVVLGIGFYVTSLILARSKARH